jgi:hypothetical protein
MPDLPSRGGGWSTLAHWISPVFLSRDLLCCSGLDIFPKGWGSEVLILRFQLEFRPPTTHLIIS